MTVLFLKRLNDTFEENAEKLIQQGKSQKEAYENPNRHNFFIRNDARWSVLATASENIGEKIAVSAAIQQLQHYQILVYH